MGAAAPYFSASSSSRSPASREHGWAVISSPAVARGVVYAGSEDGNVRAIRATDGHVIREAKTGGAVRSSPAIVQNGVYVGSLDGYLYAFEAGKRLWRM